MDLYSGGNGNGKDKNGNHNSDDGMEMDGVMGNDGMQTPAEIGVEVDAGKMADIGEFGEAAMGGVEEFDDEFEAYDVS